MQGIEMKERVEKQAPVQENMSIEGPSDIDLMAAIVDGDVRAIESLYQRYSRLLYMLIYQMVTDHQVAEDLLQEGFLSAWRHAASFAPHAGSVRSWLFSIVRHRTIDYLRLMRRRSSLKQAAWEEIDLDERMALPDVWEEAWQAEQDTHVHAALRKLPTELRMLIELAYFQQWTQREISERYHIPLGTVKGRMRRALLHLKQELIEQGMNER